MMDLDQLQSVRDRERQTDKLQQLRESFYADAAEFIADLRAERERAADAAEEPLDDPRVSRLTNDINTAEQTVEAIYERRVGKIVKAATFAAADQPAQTEGMTAEEQDLFDTLVGDIQANRERVLDVLAGRVEPGEATEATAGSDAPDGGQSDDGGAVDAADVMGGDTEPREPPSPADLEPDSASDPPDSGPSEDESAKKSDREEGTAPEEAAPGSDTDQDPEPSEGTASEGPEASDDQGRPESDAGGKEGVQPADVPRETVRITADVGDIFGVDEREYDLAEDDVVSLPAENVEPLVERGAAERLE